MADIVFVTPSYAKFLKQESIGTLILAKIAQMNDFDVKIVRFCDVEMKDYRTFHKDICQMILGNEPHIVSFYCRESDYHIAIDISKKLKEMTPDIKIVFGGPQAALSAEDTLHSFKCVDYVCCGEGENTIVGLIKMVLGNDMQPSTIPGLVWRDDTLNIIKNPLPEMLPDNYSRDFNYYDLIPQNIIDRSPSVNIDVGRGCPFSCTFCCTKTFWKQNFRLRDIDNTIDEIKYVTSTFGQKIFDFSHDLFTANKKRLIEFCNKLESENLKIRWTCSSRIDCIDYQMIDKMSSNGLISIYFGVETGSPRIQQAVNKRLDIQRCYDIIQYASSKDIHVTASFIYGFPQETDADLELTLKMIHTLLSIGVDVQLHRLTIEKGSALYDEQYNNLSFLPERCMDRFGVPELASEIKNHLELFSSFCDFDTDLRSKMKYLDMFHAMGKLYPLLYTTIIEDMLRQGSSYVNIYMNLINLIKDSLERYELSHIKITPSICYFLFQKIVYKISKDNAAIKIEDKEFKKLEDILASYKPPTISL